MRIANLVFAIAVSVASISSVLAVSERNKSALPNHWQELELKAGDAKFNLVKAAVKKQQIEPDLLPAARELATIYRQLGKQQDAAKIYRILWLAKQEPKRFVEDALELASLYSEMSAFTYAIESYQKILEFDRLRFPANDPTIARDLNNLAVCYRCYGISLTDPKKRKYNLDLAAVNFAAAAKIGTDSQLVSTKVVLDQPNIVSSNQAVLAHDRGQSD